MSEHGTPTGAACGEFYSITISDEQRAVEVDHAWLQQIARRILQDEGVAAAQISVALVDDRTIHDINRRFLEHDYPTDVISFLLETEEQKGDPPTCDLTEVPSLKLDAEVVISGETAARTARQIGCPAAHELALYLVHGLLHLCGYDDQTDADRSRMRLQEQSHLQKFGITTNYEY